MDIADIRNRIRDMVAQALPEDAHITDDDMLLMDVGFDSLDMLDLALEIDDVFSVKLPENTTSATVTINKLVEHVQKTSKAHQGG
tara:strand:- start:273 stop:527 length:255 start_codon:yes stop_codon:yes gene_type:complete